MAGKAGLYLHTDVGICVREGKPKLKSAPNHHPASKIHDDSGRTRCDCGAGANLPCLDRPPTCRFGFAPQKSIRSFVSFFFLTGGSGREAAGADGGSFR